MQERRRRLRAYRKSRRKFSCTVYGITLAWLVLALTQWLAVCLLKDFRDNVNKYYWISLIFFISAMLLFSMFIFIKSLRFVLCLNWLLSLLIVEFLIIGLFALSAQTDWKNLIAWFLICALLTYLFILIGSILPVINSKKSTPSNTTVSYHSKDSSYEDSTTTTELVVNWG
ncbi:uncharacterized protein [Drosophila pseudoobscura]|uniref:Uncharacterized protein isoform X2 n=1 Tax=Drosophila pseudoobscura pseudoobscura TaxID=46245 RepID=A0A6I8VFU6_DROPS|nr:uncharacterized protein LOC6898691 isoform X2 [Drosophila pseudoobscura]